MGFPGLSYVEPAQANQGGKGAAKARVDVVIFSTATEREMANRQDMRNWLCRPETSTVFRRELGKHKQLGLYFASLGNAEALAEQLLLSVAWYCYFDGQALPQLERISSSVCRLSAARWPKCSS